MLSARWSSMITILSICIILLIIYCIYQYYTMKNVTIPQYQVLYRINNIEIRRYAPMIIATVDVSGDEKIAINSGFRQLADFIFGNNISQNSRKSKQIQMTAPVMQAPSTKIRMTAPVMQQDVDNSVWQISFILPSEYTLDTLPQPNNKNIKLQSIPTQDWAVIRFSGRWHMQKSKQYQQALQNFIEKTKLKAASQSPVYAYYNPPWTLPFMRRNEIMILLDDHAYAESGLK